MKTKLLKKIRKAFLIKYVLDDIYRYNKELVLLDIKKSVIIRNKFDGIYTVPDLAFVLKELKETKLLKKYWDKKARKAFKRL